MTAYLLDLGVDPAGRTETGKTALDFARTAGNEALALLLERPS
jgi:ankyrin repeat protein